MLAFAIVVFTLVTIVTSVVSFRIGAASQQQLDVRKFAHLASVAYGAPVDKNALKQMLDSINK